MDGWSERKQETGRRRTRVGSGHENKAKASVNRLRARPAAVRLQKERTRLGRSAEELVVCSQFHLDAFLMSLHPLWGRRVTQVTGEEQVTLSVPVVTSQGDECRFLSHALSMKKRIPVSTGEA